MEEHKKQKIEIRPRKEGELVSHVHLLINGTEIKDIRSLKIEVEPNEIPRLILDLNLWDISVDSEFLVYQKGVGAVNFVEAKECPTER